MHNSSDYVSKMSYLIEKKSLVLSNRKSQWVKFAETDYCKTNSLINRNKSNWVFRYSVIKKSRHIFQVLHLLIVNSLNLHKGFMHFWEIKKFLEFVLYCELWKNGDHLFDLLSSQQSVAPNIVSRNLISRRKPGLFLYTLIRPENIFFKKKEKKVIF